MLAREALSCMHFRDKELNSVMTTANRNLSCFNSTAMMDAISKTTFDLSSLRSGRITIYLMLPEHQLRTGSPYLRLMITTLIRAATKNGPGEGNPITFMLDEAATLKRMPILNDAVQLLRGYGIRMIFVFQALAQIKDAFGDESQFLQSVATQLYFGTNDYETAESISRRIGDTTIEVVSKQSGWSQSRSNTKIFDPQQQSGQYSTSGSTTVSEASRRLLQASELLTMSPNAMVVFHKAMPPICLQRVRYFVDPEFSPRRLGRSERLGLVTLARSIVIAVLSVGFAFVSIEHVFGPHAFFPNQRAASAASSPEFSRPERSARTRTSGSSRRARSPRNVRSGGIILP
jgi:type IV secretion system protein VirD4